jgi:DNA-binding LacI/PurR family transcriptional regulator
LNKIFSFQTSLLDYSERCNKIFVIFTYCTEYLNMARQDNILGTMLRAIHEGRFNPGDRLPTIRDLSLEFECSPATMAAVFRDLKDRGYVLSRGRLGTIVTDTQAWGHTPEQHTAQLVGVLVCELTMVLPGIELALQEAGYSMVTASRLQTRDSALAHIEQWRKMGLHGIIWSPADSPTHEDDNHAIACAIAASGMQSVSVDRYPQSFEVNSVVSDNINAASRLTRHLIELGHRKIGLIRNTQGSTPEDRMRGYRQVLHENKIKFKPSMVLEIDHGIAIDDLTDRITAWLKKTQPTAVWSISSIPLGQALLAAAQRLNLSIPGDLSFGTFDPLIAAVPITHIIQPWDEIGHRAVELLLSRIAKPTSEIARIVIPCQMQTGQSTAQYKPHAQLSQA